MLFTNSATCRFCKEVDGCEGMVRYSTRHYAHFDCYLTARKTLDGLTAWQVGQFPWRVLRKHYLLNQAEEIRAKAKAA